MWSAPAAASRRFRSRCAAPPIRLWKVIASETARKRLGSVVPVQSNSARKPLPKPYEIVPGCKAACRAGGACRKAQPLGAHSHLWQLPVYQSAPMALMSRSICPGAWAPSISTGTPAAWHVATMRAAGRTMALPEVMWSITASFVRGVIAVSTAATRLSAVGLGKGVAASAMLAPACSATNRTALRTAP